MCCMYGNGCDVPGNDMRLHSTASTRGPSLCAVVCTDLCVQFELEHLSCVGLCEGCFCALCLYDGGCCVLRNDLDGCAS